MPNFADTRMGYALKLAQHALHRQMEERLRPLGITTAQYAVLTALRERPDQTNADLAEAAFLTPQSMQGVLAKLEAGGLVERRQDQHHGRRQLARLTDAGVKMTRAGDDHVRLIETALDAAVSPTKAEEILAVLERFHAAMRDLAAE